MVGIVATSGAAVIPAVGDRFSRLVPNRRHNLCRQPEPSRVSRRRTSASDSPDTSRTFNREFLPATMRTLSWGVLRATATTRSAAALARPRSAGARTRTLSLSPSQPAMPSRGDEGTTLIGSLIVLSCCRFGPHPGLHVRNVAASA
jgi:hypothetical protein